MAKISPEGDRFSPRSTGYKSASARTFLCGVRRAGDPSQDAPRSIVTASKDRRVWHGYSACKPQNLATVLEIFRVYYNYCKAGAGKKMPAMRLGLARAPIALDDILYLSATRQANGSAE